MEQRDINIKKSIKFGFSAKFISIFIQLILIPFAIGRIGIEKYGLYSLLITNFAPILIFSSILSGNALTLRLIESRKKNDIEDQKQIFSTSIFSIFAISFIFFVFLLLLLITTNLNWILNVDLVSSLDFRLAYALGAVLIILVELCLMPFDSAISAFQLVYLSNKFLVINNILKILLLFLFLYVPSITLFLVCNYLPRLITSIFPAFIFLKRYSYMYPNFKYFKYKSLLKIVRRGILLSLTKVSTYIYFSLPIVIISERNSLKEVAYLSGMFAIISFLGSMLTILTRTLMPSIKDASNASEMDWRNNTILKYGIIVLIILLLSAFCLSQSANQIISFYLQQNVDLGGLAIFAWVSFYFLCNWDHYTYTVLLSIDKHKEAISLNFLGSLLTLILLLRYNDNIGQILISLCIGSLICSFLPNIFIIKSALRNIKVN